MASPRFLLAPGAGAPSKHPWMQSWKKLLETIGAVAELNYDYMREGRKRPDPLPQLIAAHRAALEEAYPKGEVILIGKSMGGRVGCHVALEEERVAKVICLGYPLCGMGDPKKMRDKVLRELRKPILFVQGTRDTLCPLDLLEAVRREMAAPNELFVVESGDHSLRVPKKVLKENGKTQEEVDLRILRAIQAFVLK